VKNGKMPRLVLNSDIRGDVHLHSDWSDGENSIGQMADKAHSLGYEYIAITDHSQGLPIAGGLDDKQIKKQTKEIEKINRDRDEIFILTGAEVNIGKGGALDLDSETLKDLDIVMASIHSGASTNPSSITQDVVKAMENDHVDVLAHPTGRKMNHRPPFDLDMDLIFEVAESTGTILEIDSQPKRLDLNDINIKKAINHGCCLVVDSDAHSTGQMDFMALGVSTARRGWAQKRDIINSLPLKKFLKRLK
jgi:DNA polymerase (family 10)